VSTTTCDDVTYICQLAYTWSGASGAHTATFTSTDWTGHLGVTKVNFTVS
jgi:hypothetical protein